MWIRTCPSATAVSSPEVDRPAAGPSANRAWVRLGFVSRLSPPEPVVCRKEMAAMSISGATAESVFADLHVYPGTLLDTV